MAVRPAARAAAAPPPLARPSAAAAWPQLHAGVHNDEGSHLQPTNAQTLPPRLNGVQQLQIARARSAAAAATSPSGSPSPAAAMAPAKQPRPLSLTIISGPNSGDTLSKPGTGHLKIGRVKTGNTFSIKSQSVSSKHAEIVWDNSAAAGGGTWFLVDLDSTNGTQLNGNRKCLPSERAVALRCLALATSCGARQLPRDSTLPLHQAARARGCQRSAAPAPRAAAVAALPLKPLPLLTPPCAPSAAPRPALPAARPGHHPPGARHAAAGSDRGG